MSLSAPLPQTGPETSDDALLGGKIRFRQPVDGYRVAIDPVLLAAAVPAGVMDRVLDIGCGVGAASLCLAARVPGCTIAGLELQRDMVRLAADNAARNAIADRFTVVEGDLLRPPPQLVPGSFTQVMVNPPFLEASRASASPQPGKATASVEGEASLGDWLSFALSMLRDKGGLTLIHRADRLGDILTALAGRAGGTIVFPLWPGEGKPAKRLLVHVRKGIAAPLTIAAGLVLHGADGRYTEAAEAVLRHGAPLSLIA